MFICFILTLIFIFVVYYLLSKYVIKGCGQTSSNSEMSKEEFAGNKKITILIFLSSTCPHCVTYKNVTHPLLQKFAESKGYKLKIVPEDDSDTFSKYNIQYIPACIILNGDKHKQLSGEISVSNIEKTINNM